MKIEIRGTRFITHTYTKEDLIQLLGLGEQKPNVTLYVDIPGGGDYSNCTLEIGGEIPVLKVVIEEEIK